jgi:diguanylate cyclase (GGDEF)-like protein
MVDTSLLLRHSVLFSVFCGVISLAISLGLGLGQAKELSIISWLDILGEGSVALLSAGWIFFILISRPPGKVTTALVIGLSFFLFSALLDLFDEVMFYQDAARYLSMFESAPAAIGMLIMSHALFQWHQEQLVLNQQLQKRESDNRQHDQVDFITKLYGADYMRCQINQQLQNGSPPQFSVVMLDIDNFDNFNRRYGHGEGDRLLREISEVILMTLRSTDLVCRYAGDRFIVLLPHTPLDIAQETAEQIRQAIIHIAYKPSQHQQAVYHNLTYIAGSAKVGENEANSLLQRVNQQLDLSKQVESVSL